VKTSKFFFRLVSIAGLLIYCSDTSFAQQLPYYTSYNLNQVAINPATAGAYGYTQVNITARKDWMGFKGSPGTFTLSGEHRISSSTNPFGGKSAGGTKGNIGLGGVIFNDINGPSVRTGVKLVYAYHIKMQRSQLSMGLAFSGFQYKLNMDKIDVIQDDDPLYQEMTGRSSLFSPDATIGTYFMNDDFYIGMSADQLLQNMLKFGDKSMNLKLLRHYYFVTGYSISLHPDYYIEPSVFLKLNEQLFVQSDFTLKMVYDDQYWGGFNYRTNNDFTFLFGMRFDFFYFAYSYDFNSNPLMNYNFNTHEISMGIRLSQSGNERRGQSAGFRERY
jgi:type IX secretion system PorP/SprF family membrane protein